jgi:hypothetical protein
MQIDYDDYEDFLVDRSDGDYLKAQQDGHYNQDCSEYEAECPQSVFGVNSINFAAVIIIIIIIINHLFDPKCTSQKRYFIMTAMVGNQSCSLNCPLSIITNKYDK